MRKETYVKFAFLLTMVVMIVITLSANPAFADEPTIIIDGEDLTIPAQELDHT